MKIPIAFYKKRAGVYFNYHFESSLHTQQHVHTHTSPTLTARVFWLPGLLIGHTQYLAGCDILLGSSYYIIVVYKNIQYH